MTPSSRGNSHLVDVDQNAERPCLKMNAFTIYKDLHPILRVILLKGSHAQTSLKLAVYFRRAVTLKANACRALPHVFSFLHNRKLVQARA